MPWQGLKVLAVVPARGGSKSIPGKNLALVGGLSLVARTAGITNQLDWLDAAVLSTDDAEIADEGRDHGLDVPFVRPAELAGDASTSVDMWRHAWLTSEEHFKTRFDVSLLLEPTSPLREPRDVEATLSALVTGRHRAAATVSRAPAHFTPHKCLTVDDKGRVGYFLEEGAQHSLRQTIPPYFFRNGLCYAVCRDTLVEDRHILEDDCVAVIVERPIVNIDDPYELELADWLLSRGAGATR